MTTEVQCSVHNHTSHLVDRQSVIHRRIVRNGIYIDIYLATHNTLIYPTLTILERDSVGKVVVAQEVTIHLSVVCRRAEYLVYLACGVSLTAYHLSNPAANLESLRKVVVTILSEEMNHTKPIF